MDKDNKEIIHKKCLDCVNTCKQPITVIIYKCNYKKKEATHI